MHCVKCLHIGRDNFVTTVFALVCTYAYLKLEYTEARYQKHNTDTENGDKLPYSFV